MNTESTTPAKGILALVALTAVILVVMFALSSCAELNSIPFSVSYHDPIGGVVTFDKPAVIFREK